jgi:hypothetical protein
MGWPELAGKVSPGERITYMSANGGVEATFARVFEGLRRLSGDQSRLLQVGGRIVTCCCPGLGRLAKDGGMWRPE